MPANILRLPKWRVIDVHTTAAGQVYVRAEYMNPPGVCPQCGVVNPKVQRYGTHEQLYNDLQLHHKPTAILVQRVRYKCTECDRTFMQELPDMHPTHRATKRLVEWVQEAALKHTFAYVARRSGFDEKTVRRIFEDHVAHLERTVRFKTPEWIGIDEVHLIRSARCVIGNLKQRTVIEMLPNRGKKTVTRALLGMPDRGRVELVAMDMYRPYRDAALAAFPNAMIVVDKFHVVRMASDALDTVRRGLKERLTPKERRKLKHDRYKLLKRNKELSPRDRFLIATWFAEYPELGEAYHAKELFYDLYDDATDPLDAKAKLDWWRAQLPSSMANPFRKLTTALDNWEPYILAYFETKATNAPVEAMNRAIKQMQSEGRGYSFRALRAKILYGKPHKTGPTSIRMYRPGALLSYGLPEERDNYGVPFEALGEPDSTSEEGHFGGTPDD